MHLYPRNTLPVKKVRRFIIIFYVVGFLGFTVPYTSTFFIRITPLALLLCTYLLAVYHDSFNKNTIAAFLVVSILGFLIEVAGVNTGLIFGTYTYGRALGCKLLNTPLIIGLNWLFLTYTSISISQALPVKSTFIVFIAPLFMLGYDLVLEQVAPKMDMWSWQNSLIPLKNYLAWYIIGVFFVVLFKLFKVNTKNPLATILFTCQLVFFSVLFFLLK